LTGQPVHLLENRLSRRLAAARWPNKHDTILESSLRPVLDQVLNNERCCLKTKFLSSGTCSINKTHLLLVDNFDTWKQVGDNSIEQRNVFV
jgi:hypothetical protein